MSVSVYPRFLLYKEKSQEILSVLHVVGLSVPVCLFFFFNILIVYWFICFFVVFFFIFAIFFNCNITLNLQFYKTKLTCLPVKCYNGWFAVSRNQK